MQKWLEKLLSFSDLIILFLSYCRNRVMSRCINVESDCSQFPKYILRRFVFLFCRQSSFKAFLDSNSSFLALNLHFFLSFFYPLRHNFQNSLHFSLFKEVRRLIWARLLHSYLILVDLCALLSQSTVLNHSSLWLSLILLLSKFWVLVLQWL